MTRSQKRRWRVPGREVNGNAIHGEVIRVATLAIDGKLAAARIVYRNGHHAGRKFDERLDAAAVQRHLIDDIAVDHRSHGCIMCVHRRRIAMHRDDAAGIANAQVEIEPGVLSDFQLDAVADDGFKPRSTHENAIGARAEREDAVKAGLIRLGHSPAAGLFVANVDFRGGDFQARWILDQSGNLRSLSLSRVRKCGQTDGPNRASHLRYPSSARMA